MFSLFADQEHEAELDSLGDPLALQDKHVDFVALAAEIDRWEPRPRPEQGRLAALVHPPLGAG